MSDTSNFGFGKLVPGFDFLQSLAKGASSSIPQLPNLSNWVAPTISVEELEKRIDELKPVQFWLEQNSRALAATIQALEVQKMTLATLKGMNFSMGDVANAFKLKTADTVMSGVQKAADTGPGAAEAMKDAAKQTAIDTTKNMATGLAKEALKTATGMASQFAAKGMQTMQGGAKRAAASGTAKKTAAAKKPAARKTPAKPAAKKASSSTRSPAARKRAG